MSRIGNKAIAVPSGVELKLADSTLSVKGPKGELTEALPSEIEVTIENDQIKFSRNEENADIRALHGHARSLVSNMVTGVTTGFQKALEIVGVGYRAEVKRGELRVACRQLPHSHICHVGAFIEKEFGQLRTACCHTQHSLVCKEAAAA